MLALLHQGPLIYSHGHCVIRIKHLIYAGHKQDAEGENTQAERIKLTM